MDDLGISGDSVPLMVRRHCADHTVFYEDVPVVAVHCVDMPQAQSLSASGWLSTCDIDQQ